MDGGCTVLTSAVSIVNLPAADGCIVRSGACSGGSRILIDADRARPPSGPMQLRPLSRHGAPAALPSHQDGRDGPQRHPDWLPRRHLHKLVRRPGRRRDPAGGRQPLGAGDGRSAREPQARERSASIGVHPRILDAAGYSALIREELARWPEVIRAANIRTD
jgi:hypothetical protein